MRLLSQPGLLGIFRGERDGGPAGLVCAAFLAINGISSVIYEKHNYLGGILYHGIPEFRLPKDILKKTIDKILDLGVEVKLNQELGRDITLDYLEKEAK